MANGPSAVISAVSSALSSLATASPLTLRLLGSHLSNAQEVQALEVLNAMSANPSGAAAMLPELTSMSGLPANVINWVNQALENVSKPDVFASYMAQAKNALITAVTNAGVLGSVLGL